MNRVCGFFAFLYDFVVGDDPMIAVAIAAGLGATALLQSAGVAAWWLLPAVVVSALTASLLRATRPGGRAWWATVSGMSDELHLTIRYSDAGDDWVTAQVVEIPGAISEGRTRGEARANVLDALDVLLTPDEQLAGASRDENSESLTLTVAS